MDGSGTEVAGDGHRVLVISPVRNEAAHIERTARGMAAQTRVPDLWLVVDDGSDDGTREILRRLEAEVPFMRVLHAPQGGPSAERDRLADAREAIAFNWALATVRRAEYSHIGKLDGDVELPSGYFEDLLAEFDADRRLGIAGGALIEPFYGGWRRLRPPSYHVHGALKLYTADCLEAIGGMDERLGWDTIDETYARMKGFRTRSVGHALARHHRPSASAQGRLRGYARWGQCAYIVRYPPLWVAARALKEATRRPVLLAGAAFLCGYLRAAVRSTPRVEDEAFRRFVRGELYRRARSAVTPRLSPGA
jgi:poly-beta-1,6-N-acetyl-D-glucosamine synthase